MKTPCEGIARDMGTAPDVLLDRCKVPHETLRTLRELGYASKNEANHEAAAEVDTWMAKQPFALDMLRRHYLLQK
jgi:hypothetical protein